MSFLRVLLLVLLLPSAAFAGESQHEGYYYPKITSSEVYKAKTRVWPKSDRAARIGFVAQDAEQKSALGYAPRYAMFAKGDDAEKLIVVAFDDATLGTIYRIHALMAELTGLARVSPVLKDADLEDTMNFYDLAKLLGFAQITVSDGRKFSHRITIR
ncbi:MAG: molybdopterin-guanine dinucleotide biosynthesis protein [Rhodospirillales bacterium]|jgi:hypothetical protein|nr:molybdopterin-guanine dinucleotide biosynthesis protein [Rhodospirillales bacterium]